MIKKIAIISYTSRAEGCFSGVERYNDLLQKAIGGEIYTGTKYNCYTPEHLNNNLVLRGLIDQNTLCIVDGSWGLGIPENIPVLSVVHGTWTEFNLRNLKQLNIEPMQDKMWHRPNTKMVAVSNASAKYLEKHHGVKADKIILNGVDTEEFKPLNLERDRTLKPVVIHCGRDYNKTSHGKLQEIQNRLADKFTFLYLCNQEDVNMFYNQADIILQTSNYEGNSYFILEGMACGLPVVASNTGLFEDIEDTDFLNYRIGCIVDWNAKTESFVEAINIAYENKNIIDTRKWIQDHATFEMWAQQWKDFLKENYNYEI